MKRILVVVFIAGGLGALFASVLASGAAPAADEPAVSNDLFQSPPSTPTPTWTPTPTQGPLPDLVVPFLGGEYEDWNGQCIHSRQRYGVQVGIENIGEADAGPFVVEANGVQQWLESGLAAGEATVMWFPSYVYWDPNNAYADATFLIEESNEDNNSLSRRLPMPTQPPTCTPTPTRYYLPLVWR